MVRVLIGHTFVYSSQTVADERSRHQFLLEKITCRGPDAYAAFANILATNYPSAYDILQNDNDANSTVAMSASDVVLSCFPFFSGRKTNTQSDDEDEVDEADDEGPAGLSEFQRELPRVKFVVKKSEMIHYLPDIGTYTMESKLRGVAFIANIIHFDNYSRRNGAEADRDNLVSLFKQMGFTVFYYEDLTKSVCSAYSV